MKDERDVGMTRCETTNKNVKLNSAPPLADKCRCIAFLELLGRWDTSGTMQFSVSIDLQLFCIPTLPRFLPFLLLFILSLPLCISPLPSLFGLRSLCHPSLDHISYIRPLPPTLVPGLLKSISKWHATLLYLLLLLLVFHSFKNLLHTRKWNNTQTKAEDLFVWVGCKNTRVRMYVSNK